MRCSWLFMGRGRDSCLISLLLIFALFLCIGIILLLCFCFLFILFSFYSPNLFPNDENKKKTIRHNFKLFCNLYKFVWESINSIKIDGNLNCIDFFLMSFTLMYDSLLLLELFSPCLHQLWCLLFHEKYKGWKECCIRFTAGLNKYWLHLSSLMFINWVKIHVHVNISYFLHY